MINLWGMIVAVVVAGYVFDLINKELKRRHERHGTEDAGALQEIHRTLNRLEERIGALETLVLDRTKDEEFDRKLYS